MVERSSLPPLKNNQGKYGVIALVIILAALGLWFTLRTEEEPKAAEPPPPEPQPVVREQFEPQIEIPPEEELPPSERAEDSSPDPEKPSRSEAPKYEECYGTLSAKQILATINGAPRRQVRSCYERRLKDDNLLQGTMEVLLTIAPSGSVADVRVGGSLGDPRVYACVKRVAREWKFPPPEGGCVRTSMPFVMTPKP